MLKSCLSALEYKLIVSIAVELLDEPDSGKGTAMLSEYVEMFLSFHGSGRGGMHLLGGGTTNIWYNTNVQTQLCQVCISLL